MRFTLKSNMLKVEESSMNSYPISKIETLPHITLKKDFPFNENLQKLLSGKQLLIDEIPHSLSEIQKHFEHGYIEYRKGIENKKGKYYCNRCGANKTRWLAIYPCSRCGEDCLYCRKCIMMGRVSSCSPLLTWKGPEPKLEGSHELAWTGTLSEGQRAASAQVVKAVTSNREGKTTTSNLTEIGKNDQELLVWAVCGAGKTEVLFAGIEAALSQGKRVCIATPRTDVVLELTPRLKAVFPNITVASLYGGSEDRQLFAPLTISTTHQLLRFYQAFDVIIVDEVDAFPYSMDESLKFAVAQARKRDSALIYLTATPNQKWQQECRLGKRNYVTIPARYHRHPLPVPKCQWTGNWQKALKKGRLPPQVVSWVRARIDTNKQTLLFMPQIDLMEQALPILRQLHPAIESVHAEDPERKEKVQKMRRGETLTLLTTTILERGVTFPNIDVAVLGAEDRIFTESALVQIAGRAGRSKDYPTGDVTFFHYGKTEAMNRAITQILSMNKEAKAKGLIE